METPTQGFKLNTDGAYINETHKGGIGGVFRNNRGDWVLGYSGKAFDTKTIENELIALFHGLPLAKQHNLVPLELNVDCSVIISYLGKTHTKYCNVISDCRDLFLQFGNPLVSYVPREVNSAVNALAKGGATMYSSNILAVLEVPPLFVRRKIEPDKNEITFVQLKRHRAGNREPLLDVQVYCNSNINLPPFGCINRAGAPHVFCNDTY